MAIDTSIPTIETTMRISTRAKPRFLLPLRIGSSIASPLHGRGVNVEHILTAPGVRLGIVLHAALSPLPAVGHGIDGNPPQKFDLLVDLVGDPAACHQDFQRLGITFGPDLERTKVTLIGAVLVLVDGPADVVER